jgi:hypothetical protein
LQQPKIQRHSESILSSQRQKTRKEKGKNKPECHNRGGKEEQRKNKKQKLQRHSREISPFFSSSFLNIRRKEQPKKTRTHTIMP